MPEGKARKASKRIGLFIYLFTYLFIYWWSDKNMKNDMARTGGARREGKKSIEKDWFVYLSIYLFIYLLVE